MSYSQTRDILLAEVSNSADAASHDQLWRAWAAPALVQLSAACAHSPAAELVVALRPGVSGFAVTGAHRRLKHFSREACR